MKAKDVTLGILAGGQATRLAGTDKGWLCRGGVPQVVHWQRRFANEVETILVSANRNLDRYAKVGLRTVPDRVAGAGPLSGLEALSHACTTRWLLTLPVDLVNVNECLLPTLRAAASEHGACAEDDDGVQPLVALWDVLALRDAATRALEDKDLAIHRLHARLRMATVRIAGLRFGNVNTPDDRDRAGLV